MPESTPSVVLNALVPDDAQTIAGWGRDPEFRLAADWSEEGTHLDRVSRLRTLIEDPPLDLLRLGVQHGGVLVGYVDLRGVDSHERELGYLIGNRSRWGQGLGSSPG
ncbi:MAG: GNAT family N-acetyltransferase [Actinobacteria bacterium]|nr:GNAT family N-acetyltransferase [Actinomycetota bacterium]